MIERYHHLALASSEFKEGSCLLLNKGNEGLKGAARLELDSKWMFGEDCPRLVSVFLAGSLKKGLENRGFRRCTHIVGRRKSSGVVDCTTVSSLWVY
jgi:hypothetical protein